MGNFDLRILQRTARDGIELIMNEYRKTGRFELGDNWTVWYQAYPDSITYDMVARGFDDDDMVIYRGIDEVLSDLSILPTQLERLIAMEVGY